MAAGPIVISILANASQATATLNSTATTAQKVGAGFRKMAAPAAAGLAAIAAGAKVAIDSASDLAESVSKVGQIFGPQTAEIQKFAAGAATALGQSKTQALEAASTFGIIGQSAGLSGKDAAAFATQFTTLSSDLASFNNTSPEEAITAIGAAMRGEAEPIRKYGVLLDDATLRARAVKLGLIDSVKQGLTPQQKALAASKEILAQTGKAQGDFERTSKGAANQSRIQAAQAENLKAKLGTSLLPTYIKLQQAGLAAIAWMSKHAQAVKIAAGVIAGLAAAVLLINGAMAAGAAAMALYRGAQIAWSVATNIARAAQFAFNVVLLANPIALLIVAIVAIVAALVLFFTKTKLGQAIIAAAWAGIKAAVEVAGKAIGKAITAVVGFVKKLVSFVVTAVKLYIAVWRTAIAIMVAFALAVATKIKAALTTIGQIAGKVKTAVAKFGTLLLKAGKALIEGLIDGIKGMFGKLGGVLGDVGQYILKHKGPPKKDAILLRPAGRLIIDGLIDGLIDRRTELQKQLSAVTDTIERGVTPRVGINLGTAQGRVDLARTGPVSVTYKVDVKLDANMTQAQMGLAYARAIAAAKREGLTV